MTHAIPAYRHCPYCGAEMDPLVGTSQRCPACGHRHFWSPTVGVAVVLIENERILLGRRSCGKWCIPCGHVEWGESIEEAARREFAEETSLDVALGPALAVLSNSHNPAHLTVGVWFSGTRLSGEPKAGDDLTEVDFFAWNQIPELAFPTDRQVIDMLRQASAARPSH